MYAAYAIRSHRRTSQGGIRLASCLIKEDTVMPAMEMSETRIGKYTEMMLGKYARMTGRKARGRLLNTVCLRTCDPLLTSRKTSPLG